jgi:hypothetical protein
MITARLFQMVCKTCGKEVTRWSDKSDFNMCDCGGVLHRKYEDPMRVGDYNFVS